MLKTCILFILSIILGPHAVDFNTSQPPSVPDLDEQSKELTYRFWKDLPPYAHDAQFTINNMTRKQFQGVYINLESRLIGLLDGLTRLKCTGTLVTNRWIVTAAHCLTKEPEYVQSQFLGLTSKVHYVFKHSYHVFEMSNRSEDVVLLRNDFGLVLASEEFNVPELPSIDTLCRELAAVKMDQLLGAELIAYGYGRHASRSYTRPLFVATLRGVPCRRQSWVPCFCGASTIAGACAGDSGGPVFYKGIQIGVTSLGPSRCLKYPGASHTVFTNIQHYADFLYKTVKAPIDSMLRTGGPNAHWLTNVYFTPRPMTSPGAWNGVMSSKSSFRVTETSGCGNEGLKILVVFVCLCIFLEGFMLY